MKYTAFSIYFKTLIQHKELNYMKESLQDLVTHEVGPGTTITPEDVMSFFSSAMVPLPTLTVLSKISRRS
ncbi:hypothetical protein GCM10020331_098520 [Ectobacillus funiculus]